MTEIPAPGASEELERQLGPAIVDRAADLPQRSYADWSGLPAAEPAALLRPHSTAEVSACLAACTRLGLPLVIQGGLTGLSGGACVQPGEVALSLERMRAISAPDPVSGTLVAEAGATLADVQAAAEAAGLMFALDLGARGSCTIGGNIATNAGGVRVIKYGMMRDQLLGLEAVLPDGRVVDNMHRMLKNNSGYDLRNLLAGSEGTLAVITRAVLRLRPLPGFTATAWCGIGSFEAVEQLLVRARAELGESLAAFEVMWSSFIERLAAHSAGLRLPLAGSHRFHLLLESSSTLSHGGEEAFLGFLGRCMEAGLIEDAVLARSEREARAMWAIRESPEVARMIPNPVVFDVSAGAADVGRMVRACEAEVARLWPGSAFVALGHLGDGNIHLVIEAPEPGAEAADAVEKLVCAAVQAHGGSISAEHGIGLKKRAALPSCRAPVDLALMAAIKRAFDPAGMLNPGRILG